MTHARAAAERNLRNAAVNNFYGTINFDKLVKSRFLMAKKKAPPIL
jgi:hypothetical protein